MCVCVHACVCVYVGDTSGTGTVVHPSAHILAEGGPIVIGENNLIQEQVTIINRYGYHGVCVCVCVCVCVLV